MTETIFDHDRPTMKTNIIAIIAELHAKYYAIPDYDYEHEHHCVEHEGTTEKVTTFNQDLTYPYTVYRLPYTYLRVQSVKFVFENLYN